MVSHGLYCVGRGGSWQHLTLVLTICSGLHLPARPSWVPHASADMSSSLFGGNLLMDRPKEEQVAKQSTAAAVQEALWGADLVLPAAVSVAAAVAAMFGADDTSASLATISATPAAAAALSALATLAATASTAAPPPARSPAAAAAAAASAASSVSVVERPVETAAAAAEEENAAPGPEPPTPQDPTPTPAAAAATAAATEASPGANMSWWQRWASDTKALQTKLQSLGLAGVVAYGLFNTLYYTGMFLFVWFYVAQVPAGERKGGGVGGRGGRGGGCLGLGKDVFAVPTLWPRCRQVKRKGSGACGVRMYSCVVHALLPMHTCLPA
jgi:hypothetical protein